MKVIKFITFYKFLITDIQMKKLIFILISILVLTNTAFAIQLSDMQNHWAKDTVQQLIDLKAISGYEDGTFKPDNNITRAEFVKVLLASLGINPGVAQSGHWANNYIHSAKEKGYLKDDEFKNIDKDVTRGEIAKLIIRAMQNESYPTNIQDYSKQITDYNTIDEEYKDYMLKAYVKGIITGYEDGSIKADSTATRAETATMIIRLLNPSQRKIPELQKDIAEIPFPKTDFNEVIAHLKEIPADHEVKTIDKAHDLFMKAYGRDLNELFNLAKGYMETDNNFDYRTVNKEQYKNELSKYHHPQTWWGYNSDGSKIYTSQYLDNYIEKLKRYKVTEKARFITDKSLVHLGGIYSGWRVRGTLQFMYGQTTNKDYFPKEFNVELGKWYEADIEIEFGKVNWSNDYTVCEIISLGEPRLIEGE